MGHLLWPTASEATREGRTELLIVIEEEFEVCNRD
jgi:hypothetical protein